MVTVKERVFDFIREPVRLTFLLSVILSLIAIYGAVTIDKDGAFYIDIAQTVSKEGVSAAFDRFNWPWYSILIAIIHNLTKVDHELVAYVLTVLFMAGACSLTVSIVKNKTPEAVYWAVLLVLSVPVFNEFRASIIRETGFWFFTILTVWLVVSNSKASFVRGLAIQLAIVCAALFRLEAVFIALAVFVYLILDNEASSVKEKSLNLFKTFYGFFAIFLLGFIAAFGTGLLTQSRVANYLYLINPYAVYESFSLVSDQFAQIALLKWSHSDAGVIVFFGFLAALILRIVTYAGVASFVLLDSMGRDKLIEGAEKYKLNFIAIVLYFFILMIFFFQLKFINSRYTSMLLLLSIPIVSVAIHGIKFKWSRLINGFIVVSVLFMFANVVSTSTKKIHYFEAAQWVKDNTNATDNIYYDDSRIAYYAGRGYPNMPSSESILSAGVSGNNYDYFLIESSVGDKVLLDWIEKNNLEVLAEASNGKKVLFILKK